MGWSFRRAVRFGPLRVNLSRSGVSLSGGVRGARVNVGPRGTYVSLSGGGFRYRRKLDTTRSSPAESTPALPDAPETAQAVGTPAFAALPETSTADAMQDVAMRLKRIDWFVVYLVAATFGVLATGFLGHIPQVVVAVVAVALAAPIYIWSNERRTARLIYDIEDQDLVDRFALASAAGEALASANKLWHVWWSASTSDWKRNAGASQVVKRTDVLARRASLPHVESNIEPWSVPVGPQQLLFLPDRLLVREGRRFAPVPYDRLSVVATVTDFIEAGRVPPDSKVVRTTWRYVNKSGGPDRRFNNNRQLSVARYGELVLESDGGLRVLLNVSSVDAAERAARALAELRGIASSAQAPIPESKPPPSTGRSDERDPLLSLLCEPPAASASGSTTGQSFAFAVILKYIAMADRRFTQQERSAMIDALVTHGAGDASVLNTVNAMVDSIKPDAPLVDAAVKLLGVLELDLRKEMVASAWSIARADGKITPKEQERLQDLCARMNVPPPTP